MQLTLRSRVILFALAILMAVLIAVAAPSINGASPVSQADAGKRCPAVNHGHSAGQLWDYTYQSLHLDPHSTKWWWKERQNWAGGTTFKLGTKICYS